MEIFYILKYYSWKDMTIGKGVVAEKGLSERMKGDENGGEEREGQSKNDWNSLYRCMNLSKVKRKIIRVSSCKISI